jgi:spore maturation protein SpmA
VTNLLAQASQADSGAGPVVGILLLVLFAAGTYFLPTTVAAIRRVPNKGSVIVVNLLLGWTFVGWVVAMAMAAWSQLAPVQVNVNPPPSPTPAQISES